jgi:hypothetical protein
MLQVPGVDEVGEARHVSGSAVTVLVACEVDVEGVAAAAARHVVRELGGLGVVRSRGRYVFVAVARQG